MPNLNLPGNDEAALIGFMVSEEILGALVYNKVLTNGDIRIMLNAIADRLADDPATRSKKCAVLIRERILARWAV